MGREKGSVMVCLLGKMFSTVGKNMTVSARLADILLVSSMASRVRKYFKDASTVRTLQNGRRERNRERKREEMERGKIPRAESTNACIITHPTIHTHTFVVLSLSLSLSLSVSVIYALTNTHLSLSLSLSLSCCILRPLIHSFRHSHTSLSHFHDLLHTHPHILSLSLSLSLSRSIYLTHALALAHPFSLFLFYCFLLSFIHILLSRSPINAHLSFSLSLCLSLFSIIYISYGLWHFHTFTHSRDSFLLSFKHISHTFSLSQGHTSLFLSRHL